MRIKSFKILNLALLGIQNVRSSAVCSGGATGTPVVAVAQPGAVENCGMPSQPLVYDYNTTGQTGGGNGGFTPECLVPGGSGGNGGQGGFTPFVQQVPSTECIPVTNQPPASSITTQIVQQPPVMATTIITPPPPGTTPPTTPPGGNTPPGTTPPGTTPPGTTTPPGGNPPGGSTPPPPKQETQCTVTTKLDCEPVTPGTEENPPAEQPPSEQPPSTPPGGNTPPTTPPTTPNGPPAQTTVVHHVTESVPPQPRIISVVPPAPPIRVVTPPPQPMVEVPKQVVVPPTSFVPSNQPMICATPNGLVPGGSRSQIGGGSPRPSVPIGQAQPTCIAQTVPQQLQQPPAGGYVPSTTLGMTPGVPVPQSGGAPACSTPQNALSALCGSNNASSTTPYAVSNVGAACALPNAEACLAKAIENVGKVNPSEAASCMTTTKQPMVEVGMLLPASEKYMQAYNNPCVMG